MLNLQIPFLNIIITPNRQQTTKQNKNTPVHHQTLTNQNNPNNAHSELDLGDGKSRQHRNNKCKYQCIAYIDEFLYCQQFGLFEAECVGWDFYYEGVCELLVLLGQGIDSEYAHKIDGTEKILALSCDNHLASTQTLIFHRFSIT